MFFFFFSSRRRHTRCGRDWSSDACSSDLGLPAALYASPNLTNQAGQYNYLQGGNVNLEPEKSKSYTLGVVWSPMRNLSGSVDFWKIKLDKVVSRIPPALAVTNCINS